ncbi:MAG: hypothetical protein MI864_02030 [Pseudomonadales bacterium]|nr:hypothetical protein [Pseudomonadales bacterium]
MERISNLIEVSQRYLWASFMLLLSQMGHAQEWPEPAVLETSQYLCKEAHRREAYNTEFLQLFTTLVQGKDDWLFRTDVELGHEFGPAESALPELQRFNDALQSMGTTLIVVSQPTRGLVHRNKLPDDSYYIYDYERAAKAFSESRDRFRAAGIFTPDLTALLDEDEPDSFFFKRDHHWSPYGAQRTAQLVAEEIKQHPLYADLPKKEYTTRRIGYLRKDGSLGVAASKICGIQQNIQTVPELVTETAETDSEAVDLFSDDGEPMVAIVGTSNTKGSVNYNFAGYLQEYLSVDILNEAMAGGSFNGALDQYLPSPLFQDSPPVFLIWEVPVYHQLSNEAFYRQMIPAVYNGCEQQKTVLQRKVKLKPGNNQLFHNARGGVLPLISKDYMVDLQFSDSRIYKFKTIFWYLNGKKEKVQIDRNPRVRHEGRYFIELSQKPRWAEETFLSLELDMPETLPSGTTVVAKMCQRPDL